jgi:H+-transporting ATPase
LTRTQNRELSFRCITYNMHRLTNLVIQLMFSTKPDIIVFTFYLITSLRIVPLAILNDMHIMSIAYDNVHYSVQPERWNISPVLEVSNCSE